MIQATDEFKRLADIAADSWYGKGVSATMVAYSVRIFSRHWRPGSCLELGPAEGLATASLVTHFEDLTCVDGERRLLPRTQLSATPVSMWRAAFSRSTILVEPLTTSCTRSCSRAR